MSTEPVDGDLYRAEVTRLQSENARLTATLESARNLCSRRCIPAAASTAHVCAECPDTASTTAGSAAAATTVHAARSPSEGVKMSTDEWAEVVRGVLESYKPEAQEIWWRAWLKADTAKREDMARNIRALVDGAYL